MNSQTPHLPSVTFTSPRGLQLLRPWWVPARTGDADADYWTAVLYAAEYALLLGCQLQVVLAMTAVNAANEPTRASEPNR